MKKAIPYWQMGGFIFTGVVGTFLHFLFDWASGNVVAGLFSAVNESIWEHLKLLFYPMVAVAGAEYAFWGKKIPAFWCVKLTGGLIGLVLIPVIYYTYTGALGVKADWFNIAIFFIAAGFVYWLETIWLEKGFGCCVGTKRAILLLDLIFSMFVIFTFMPPHIPLFQDPLTGTYGFQG